MLFRSLWNQRSHNDEVDQCDQITKMGCCEDKFLHKHNKQYLAQLFSKLKLQDGSGEVSDHIVVLIDMEYGGGIQERILRLSLNWRSNAHDVSFQFPILFIPIAFIVLFMTQF